MKRRTGRNTGARALALGALLAATSLSGAFPQMAHAQGAASRQQLYDFDLPVQPLGTAVNKIASITGLQVLYNDSESRSIQAPALKGRMSADEALSRLLAGSGFAWQYVRPGVITLRPVSAEGNVEGERLTSAVRVEGAVASPYYGGTGQAAGVNGINGSRDITATEGTGSFTSGALTIGSKVPKAMKDVPVSVSVLTSERLQQQNISDFTEAMDRLPGVTLIQNGNSMETQFVSRGFTIDTIQVDGGAPLARALVNNVPNIFQPQIDMSQYDHIELLRGAAGLFNGYGQPSGSVNLVRKKPLDHGQVTWEGQVGSWQNYRTVLDATSPLALDGHLRGRIVMTYQNKHYFYDLAKDDKVLLYGVADLDITPTTLLTTGISYTRQNNVPWFGGLPRYQDGSDLKLPRSTSLVFPWSRWKLETIEEFATLEQKIGDDWTAKLNITHNRQTSGRKYGSTSGTVRFQPIAVLGTTMSAGMSDSIADQWSTELSLSGAFTIFGQRQEVLFGVSRARVNSAGSVTYSSLMAGTAASPYIPYPGGPKYYNGSPDGQRPTVDVQHFNAFDPRFNEPPSGLKTNVVDDGGQTIWVGYANFLFTAFDRLHLATGVRYSYYSYNSDSTDYCASTTSIGCVGRQIGQTTTYGSNHYGSAAPDFSWPPTVTLSYDLTHALTVHGSYTDIYTSRAEYLTPELKPIDPITGSNIELGLKWAPHDGKLNASVAFYRARRKGFNMAVGVQDYNLTPEEKASGATFMVILPDGRRIRGNYGPSVNCCSTNNPDWRLDDVGVDAELSGELARGWQISAAYTYSKTTTNGSPYVQDGLPFESRQPLHLFKLWSSYDFRATHAKGLLSRLSVSGGMSWRSQAYQSGSACVDPYILPDPNRPTNFVCPPGSSIDYAYVQKPYALFDLRLDYRVNEAWSFALNVENVTDTVYYQTMGSSTTGNWYGAPRNFTLTARGKW